MGREIHPACHVGSGINWSRSCLTKRSLIRATQTLHAKVCGAITIAVTAMMAGSHASRAARTVVPTLTRGMTEMEFEAALAQEAVGVFGRTGLTPSQLADGLTECQEVRQSWVDQYVKMRGKPPPPPLELRSSYDGAGKSTGTTRYPFSSPIRNKWHLVDVRAACSKRST